MCFTPPLAQVRSAPRVHSIQLRRQRRVEGGGDYSSKFWQTINSCVFICIKFGANKHSAPTPLTKQSPYYTFMDITPYPPKKPQKNNQQQHTKCLNHFFFVQRDVPGVGMATGMFSNDARLVSVFYHLNNKQNSWETMTSFIMVRNLNRNTGN